LIKELTELIDCRSDEELLSLKNLQSVNCAASSNTPDGGVPVFGQSGSEEKEAKNIVVKMDGSHIKDHNIQLQKDHDLRINKIGTLLAESPKFRNK